MTREQARAIAILHSSIAQAEHNILELKGMLKPTCTRVYPEQMGFYVSRKPMSRDPGTGIDSTEYGAVLPFYLLEPFIEIAIQDTEKRLNEMNKKLADIQLPGL